MSAPDWQALGHRLGLAPLAEGLSGRRGAFLAGLAGSTTHTSLCLLVHNPERRRWTLTRRWEPQARAPRKPDAATVQFRDVRLTERYVGTAADPDWFRTTLTDTATDALVAAADANRLGACTIELRDHVLAARYRTCADTVPDLAETLDAMMLLANLLDGAAAGSEVDTSREPLLRSLKDTEPRDLTGLVATDAQLVCAVPRPPGLLAKLRPAERIVIDWEAGTMRVPDRNVSLTSVRQVLLIESPAHTDVAVIDLGGGLPLVGRVPGACPPAITAHPEWNPPLLRISLPQ